MRLQMIYMSGCQVQPSRTRRGEQVIQGRVFVSVGPCESVLLLVRGFVSQCQDPCDHLVVGRRPVLRHGPPRERIRDVSVRHAAVALAHEHDPPEEVRRAVDQRVVVVENLHPQHIHRVLPHLQRTSEVPARLARFELNLRRAHQFVVPPYLRVRIGA